MNTLAERVKMTREALKQKLGIYTQAYVAKELGLEQQSYNDIESGKSKRPRNIEKLAEILKVSPEWLQFGTGEAPTFLDMALAPQGKVPIVEWSLVRKWCTSFNIEALINAGSFQVNISSVGDPLSKLQFISVPDKKNDKQFALKVKDDSMTAPMPGKRSFLENDIIIVDPEVIANDNDFVIALQSRESDTIFAQYVSYGGKQYLKPLNPQYPLIELNDGIEICGVVIAHLDVLI